VQRLLQGKKKVARLGNGQAMRGRKLGYRMTLGDFGVCGEGKFKLKNKACGGVIDGVIQGIASMITENRRLQVDTHPQHR